MSSFWIKIIAILIMLLDHTTIVFVNASDNFTLYFILRAIGRIAFPIFCFLIVEGYQKTKDLGNYIIRLALFALISEIPFDRALLSSWVDFEHQNVYFTLVLGLIAIYCFEIFKDDVKKALLIGMGIGIIAEFMKADYGAMGVWLILAIYIFRESKYRQVLAGAIVIIFTTLCSYLEKVDTYSTTAKMVEVYAKYYKTSNIGVYAFLWMEVISILGLIVTLSYNGKRGFKVKYIFYAFYPMHLIVLYIISCCLI